MHEIHDMTIVDHLVSELACGRIRSIAFVVESDVETTTPLYGLAIATARRGWRLGLDNIRYWFVTPEREPVSVAASQRLEPEGIAFVGSAYAEVRQGVLLLDPVGTTLDVDLVVSLDRCGGFWLTPDSRRLVRARFVRRRSPVRGLAAVGAHD